MSQAQEPSASQHEVQQPTDEPKVLGGGNMDPTNPLAGLENPEAEAKATEMGTTIPSQGPPPELSTDPDNEPTCGGGSQPGECVSFQKDSGDTAQAGSQPTPSSQA
ncbi:hypothetical protein VOLCADRAFT_88927 [Volvox carteri f. nagariensis]|uniref:Uncharacterized protein n=1 Tax=Volvox carteri f. nagariensis TaxID=3068 RepID=D8TQB9_VOLCA|nr:uncharacterized protein VOLCADRAFT_88927 [Volvox carteri f. nagariensis]EFJ50377.1 hypothetical protein VOLCADRAFT_88927 [Volvox carteri f. nagariensis]|eukprot:XP_002948502.1 hypothetical protein VOLCADRAFT_88927 [Volvox carteri f. nagariensis]